MSNNYTINKTLSMAEIPTVENLQETDEMVKMLFKYSREILETGLDRMSPDELLKIGGRLAGMYAYFGQKSSYARAERDIAVSTYKQVKEALVLARLSSNKDYKVTHAKASAVDDLKDEENDTIRLDAIKNQWESITDSTKTLILFIQSALAIKKGEMAQSRNINDNSY
jgi:hypothetical protein